MCITRKVGGDEMTLWCMLSLFRWRENVPTWWGWAWMRGASRILRVHALGTVPRKIVWKIGASSVVLVLMSLASFGGERNPASFFFFFVRATKCEWNYSRILCNWMQNWYYRCLEWVFAFVLTKDAVNRHLDRSWLLLLRSGHSTMLAPCVPFFYFFFPARIFW